MVRIKQSVSPLSKFIQDSRPDDEDYEKDRTTKSKKKTKKVIDDNTPRVKNEFQALVDRLKRAIRKKDDWKTKIQNPIIRQRYIEESVAQGALREAIETALQELDVYEGSSEDFDLTNIAADHLIRSFDKLRHMLETQLDAIANLPEKDFHPGSDEKVQDLIHPSLFPYIDASAEDEETFKARKKPQKNPWQVESFDRPFESSEYQWLPAIFHVSPDNKVSIRSYINNLDKEEHPELYDTIASIFEKLYPHVNKLVHQVFDTLVEGYYVEEARRTLITESDMAAPQTAVELKCSECDFVYDSSCLYPGYQHLEGFQDENWTCNECSSTKRSFWGPQPTNEDQNKNKNDLKYKLEKGELQVIVKACNYVLKPGEEYEGSWHVEGMTHEQIIASAIYYYSSSPTLQDQGLAFRVENQYDCQYGPQGQPKWQRNTPLGAIRTTQGRVLLFSNKYQHKVTLLQNPGTEVAHRKILCFFIINPKRPIISTREVAPQQWYIQRRKQRKQLLLVAKRFNIRFPKDVVNLILEYAKSGMTLEEAKQHRLKLMEQRKYVIKAHNERLEREYSLCEH